MAAFEDVDHQLGLVLGELDRRMDGQARRLGSIETIAGALVASAAIVSTLSATTQKDGWLIAALILNLLAGVLGLMALLPRKFSELVPLVVRESVLSANKVDASIWLIDQKTALIELRERLVRIRYRILRIGLLALLAGIVCVVFAVIGLRITLAP